MKWATGNWTSAPSDGRAFLERHEEGHWFAYQTDEAGTLMDGFPKLREEPFDSVEEGQAWVEANVPARDFDIDDPIAYARLLQGSKTNPIKRLHMLRARFLLSLHEAKAADYQAKGLDLEEEQGSLANKVSMGCKVEGSWDGTRPKVVKYDDVGPTFLYATTVTVRCEACQTQMKGVSTTEWACPNEACPEHGKPVVTGAFPAMREEGDDVVGG